MTLERQNLDFFNVPLALLEPHEHHLCGLSVSLVAAESELLIAS